MSNNSYFSRIEKFYQLSIMGRREALQARMGQLAPTDWAALDQALSHDVADCMSENVVGSFSLPMAVAPNFLVDGQACLVPMVTEEPSVVAACSKMAKLVGLAGGFSTSVDRALIKGQVQIYQFADVDQAMAALNQQKNYLISELNAMCPNMGKRGGGVVDLGLRMVKTPACGSMILIEPVVDVVDAMGANVVNTMMEGLAAIIPSITPCQIGLRILSNLCDQRLATATCAIPWRALATDSSGDNGRQVAEKMLMAQAFAEADVYRACTHNKGILNGIDAVAIATGNDFRAIEAGAHAFAARGGGYMPLTTISLDEEHQVLRASLVVPMAVGVVGGSCAVHPGVRLAKKILGDFALKSAKLSSVMVSVGLAQCLAAIYALSIDGIQKGHMKLHARRANIAEGGHE